MTSLTVKDCCIEHLDGTTTPIRDFVVVSPKGIDGATLSILIDMAAGDPQEQENKEN